MTRAAPSHRAGFTLIELVVGLVIAALVLLTAHRLFAVAIDGVRTAARAHAALDREEGGRAWLRSLLGSLETGQVAGDAFEGHATSIVFTTWVPAGGGWAERKRVTLSASGGRLLADVGGGPPLVLAEGIADVNFDYLLVPGIEARWVSEWVSPVSPPLLVRMRVHRGPRSRATADTALYLIKARG